MEIVLAGATTADPAATSAGVWILIGVAGLLLLGGLSVRVVAEHERVIVSRLGRLARVGGPGLVIRIPGLERLTTVSLRPVHLELSVSATTRDGVPVHVLATGSCRVTDPGQTTATSPNPITDAATELDSQLAKQVARTDLAELLPTRELLEARLPRDVTRVTAGWGVEVFAVVVNDIEARLTADLLHSLQRHAKADDR